jgi:hypothetical protein
LGSRQGRQRVVFDANTVAGTRGRIALIVAFAGAAAAGLVFAIWAALVAAVFAGLAFNAVADVADAGVAIAGAVAGVAAGITASARSAIGSIRGTVAALHALGGFAFSDGSAERDFAKATIFAGEVGDSAGIEIPPFTAGQGNEHGS